MVRTPGSGWWEGTVSPHGALVIRNKSSMRADAPIDTQGTVIVTYVWRKQSG